MKIDLTLQANFWNTSPSISIKLDNKVIREFNNFVDKQNTIISIETDIKDGEHQLVIEQQNKLIQNTVLEDSKIIIDNISIEPLLDKAFFYPQYPEPWLSQQKQIGKEPPIKYDYCRILHHNGEWKLNFTSPIHVWFFQNITLEI